MTNPDGLPIWFELTTGNQDRAQLFYETLAGWTVTPSGQAEHGGYRIASAADGGSVAGLMTPPSGMKGVPGWAVYFAADDVDGMAERVTRLGGRVHFGPQDIPHVGRFATVADPQGVVFQIMKGAGAEGSQAFGQMSGNFGHGVWIELATPDIDGALAFYGALFGWTKEGAMPMGEMGEDVFIGAGESRPGAIMSSAATGAPARWNWYIHVPDIDAALVSAEAGGAHVLQGPDQIPGGDYSANVSDPDGHQIGVVGPRK